MITTLEATRTAYRCECGTEVAGKRRPTGWKKHADRMWCVSCWKDSFVLRAITIPVAGPVDCSWEDLRKPIRDQGHAAARVANMAIRRLAAADIVRTPDMAKMPAMKFPYLYPDARIVGPELDSNSTTALLQSVERKYGKARFAVTWLMQQALPTYRSPMPVPYHRASWKASFNESKRPVVSVRIGGERRLLRLRGGRQFRRQLGDFAKIVSGEALQGELTLFEHSGGEQNPGERSQET